MMRPLLPCVALACGLASCGSAGGGVDPTAVQSAQIAIVRECGGRAATDDRALATAIARLVVQYRRQPRAPFRFEGGQAQTTMPAEVAAAADRLLVCRPGLARHLVAETTGGAP